MKPVSTDISFPDLERAILQYWKDEDIFRRSMEKDAPLYPLQALYSLEDRQERPRYVFYDGPPFATGLPHYGHLLAGTIKDVVGRFFTMKGYCVDRRFGWDCHGVPVEFEIQKTLELHGAKAIREFGIDRFNEECRSIVLRYTKEWREFVERAGRWVDFEREYRTMDLDYMESIWWVVKSLWDRGLISEGFKCVPYSWAINTPLSNFEANLNYKTVQDPALTIRFALEPGAAQKIGLSLPAEVPLVVYAWTTTPWTLPSNMALAVGEEIRYGLVLNPVDNEAVIVALDLIDQIFPGVVHSGEDSQGDVPRLLAEIRGGDLEGCSYKPIFPYFAHLAQDVDGHPSPCFRIHLGSFVTAQEGTGIVHLASFGEDDLGVFIEKGIPIIDPVDEDGRFTQDVPDFAGLNVKEADPKIIRYLKDHNLVVSQKTIEHSYPFCWRTDQPLIYRSISSWFVKVESIKEQLRQMNSTVHWVPGHVGEGRMGKWLEGARDWAISRNRFWGTPLPIWRCDACSSSICLGSIKDLEERTGQDVKDLHRHFIDRLEFKCDHCGSLMKRVPEVLDCWFESGAMPYAQAHYPFEDRELFEANFPADFIAEGLDQTRGWFYTLLVLSTALFGRPAFRNVIVNGIVLAEDGKKMSKSLKNYPSPDLVMDEFGADALRLYLLSSSATRGEELRFSKRGVREVVRQHLLPLWNAYNFLVTYALVDGWTPEHRPSTAPTNILDRWILSKTISLVTGVDKALSSYHLYAAISPILDFIDQLTNWYIRLNRRRFWAEGKPTDVDDKNQAYATLHRVLLTYVRVLAPLAPFISEELFRNLKEGVPEFDCDSVHFTSFPAEKEFAGSSVDPMLERAMDLFEEVILLGRSVRNEVGIKVRQPLKELKIIYPDPVLLESLRELEAYIKEELNVKAVSYTSEEEQFVELKAQLNTKSLGKVLGPQLGSDGMKRLHSFVNALSTDKIRDIEDGASVEFESLELAAKDFIIRRIVKQGLNAVASSGKVTIRFDTNISRELRFEGLAREFVNRVQRLRKEFDFQVTDRIAVQYMTAHDHLALALDEYREYVTRETLAVDLQSTTDPEQFGAGYGNARPAESQEIDGKPVVICLSLVHG